MRKQPGQRNREPLAIPVIQTALLRQMHPPVVADLDAGRDDDLPGMAVEAMLVRMSRTPRVMTVSLGTGSGSSLLMLRLLHFAG